MDQVPLVMESGGISIVTLLSIIGGIVVFFGTLISIMIGVIWKQRNAKYDEQLALGKKAFAQQEEFNSWIKKKINNHDSDIENIKKKINLNGDG